MGSWIEEKPTMELRWYRYEDTNEPDVLQQLWKIARGGLGRVEYTEEWRDIRIVPEKEARNGR